MLRVGAVVYLVACLLCLVVHTPMGSNIERYGVLLAGPLLLCALAGSGGRLRGRRPRRRSSAPAAGLSPFMPASRSARKSASGSMSASRAVVGVALCAIVVWILWGPVRETAAVAGSQATQVSYYAPVERYLLSHGASIQRVEVPLTRSHWEAALLAPNVSLARGWEKQLEERYDSVLLKAGLTASAYRAWLDEQAVSYVALPDVPLDPSSAQEGRLIRRGLPYLRLVFAEQALAGVRGPCPDAAAERPGEADGAWERILRAARPRRGNATGTDPLHPLLHGRVGRWLRGERSGGLDVCARPRPG